MKRFFALTFVLFLLSSFTVSAEYGYAGIVRERVSETSLATAPALISYVQAPEDLEKTVEQLASTVVFRIGADGNVISDNGEYISTLEKAVSSLADKIIIGFDVTDKAGADLAISCIEAASIEDVTFFSSDAGVVLYIREYSNTHGRIYRAVLDYSKTELSALTDAQLLEIRNAANAAMTKIILLPSRLARYEYVEYLRRLYMTVWVKSEAPITRETEAYWLINSGADGIVTYNISLLEDIMLNKYAENSFTHTPFIIAHRGAKTLAPENTLEAAMLAYTLGADMIELDINLTSDGHIIVLHDDTIRSRVIEDSDITSVNVNELTLEQVQSVYVNRGFEDEYPTAVVPTLESYFKEFCDKDVILLIEYKSQTAEIGTKLAALIEQYNMADKVNTLTYSSYDYPLPRNALKEKYPGISVSRLCGAAAESGDIYTTSKVYDSLKTSMCFSATLSPEISMLTKNAYNYWGNRGMSVWPWTVTEFNFDDFYFMGTAGITTDYVQLASQMVKKIDVSGYAVSITPGESHALIALAHTYDKTVFDISEQAELVVLENDGVATIENGTAMANKTGKVVYMWKYTAQSPKGKPYTLYTQPVTVTVANENIPQMPIETDVTAVLPDDSTAPLKESSGKNITDYLIIAGVILIATLISAAIVKRSK